jgi:RimJ/RimL family protein N-acetyltransferase
MATPSGDALDELEFVALRDVDVADLLNLMNDPRVRRHMPLASGTLDADDVRTWIASKEALWDRPDRGPWGVLLGGRFAGWAGVQPHREQAELAVVLRPDAWGAGPRVASRLLDIAFGSFGLSRVYVLLPPSRTRVAGLPRLGFVHDGTEDVDGEVFIRYRLEAPIPGPSER